MVDKAYKREPVERRDERQEEPPSQPHARVSYLPGARTVPPPPIDDSAPAPRHSTPPRGLSGRGDIELRRSRRPSIRPMRMPRTSRPPRRSVPPPPMTVEAPTPPPEAVISSAPPPAEFAPAPQSTPDAEQDPLGLTWWAVQASVFTGAALVLVLVARIMN